MSRRRRVAILWNPGKAEAEATAGRLAEYVKQHAELAATGVVDDAVSLREAGLDRIIVLGGDGSILAVARGLGEQQVPIAGVNFGKLGYLAEFTVEELKGHLEAVLGDAGIVSERMMIDTCTFDGDGRAHCAAGVNDCVVHAGPPYRMIELAISVDGAHLTNASCDGLVIATPSGSTAHNMAIGGPILQSRVNAVVLSPISPHSLTFRPLVVDGTSVIEVLVRQANPGTTMVIDGQVTFPLTVGHGVRVTRSRRNFQLVHNPTHSRWYTLTKKLKWGQ